MRKLLFVAFSAFLSASGVLAHTVLPFDGTTVTLTYGEGQFTQVVLVSPAPGEQCVVTGEVVEIYLTAPLLDIEDTNERGQPALFLTFSVIPKRKPLNGPETTTVHVSWRATGFHEDGTKDPECNGSGETHFSVIVQAPTSPPAPPPPRKRPSRH